MSYVLKRIISGELVCIPGKRGRVKGGYQPGKAVIADHPVPLRMPLRWWYDMKARRVRIEPMEVPVPTLSSFKTLLDNPPKWRVLLMAEEPRK